MSKKEKRPAALQSGAAQEVVPPQQSVSNLPVRQGPPDWAAEIRAAWQKTLDSILETGRKLNQANEEMPYGLWLAMVKSELPFGPDTAQRLMAIANNPVLVNTGHARFLPPHYETLYALTRLDKKLGAGTLEAKIQSGEITPATQRKEVQAMLRPAGQEKKTPKPSREAKLAKELEATQEHVVELEAAFDDPQELDRLREENHALKRENLALQSEVEELRAALGKQPLKEFQS
jgi:hypothetical protein